MIDVRLSWDTPSAGSFRLEPSVLATLLSCIVRHGRCGHTALQPVGNLPLHVPRSKVTLFQGNN